MTPLVSVVVPTYRRLPLLERCLSALGAQTLEPDRYEVVVVHDGPSDDMVRAVGRWQTRWRQQGGPELTLLTPAHRGPAAARNAGWRAAKAEWIAFTDDDTDPYPTWLEAALAALGPDVDAAWGRIVVPLRKPPTDYERDAAGLARAEFATANCFCRKQALERIGGFDERFEVAWREDSDLYFRLLESGARIVRVPHALVLHPVRPARWGVSLAQQRKVAFDALLFKKHRELYRARIRRAPRWDYYAIVAALSGALVALAAGAPALALVCAAAWALLTARFCRLRLARTSRSLPHVAEMIVTSAAIPPLAVFWRAVGALRFRVLLL